MRIISKFRDYYDNIQGIGSDHSDVFVRESDGMVLSGEYNQLTDLMDTIPHLTEWKRVDKEVIYDFTFTPFIIGFCGKSHLVYRFESGQVVQNFYNEEDVSAFIENDLAARFPNSFKKYFPRQLMGWERRWANRGWGIGRNSFKQSRVSQAFVDASKLDLTDVFQQLKAPIFRVEHRHSASKRQLGDQIHVTSNISLEQFEFAKIIDPYTAFQEISMYRSGVLGAGEPDMVTISDVDKRDAKGFDEKSFKTESPGKKRKRKRKSK